MFTGVLCYNRHSLRIRAEVADGALLGVGRGTAVGDSLGDEMKKYKTILLDPPWDYENFRKYQGWKYSREYRIRPLYDVMSIDKIKKLPIPDLLEKNAHLYLWSTNIFLQPALEILAYWGLSYKTAITWIKSGMGMGYYYRVSTEHCLFAVKGSLRLKMRNTQNYFYAKKTKHSKKPLEMYSIIENNSYPKYLELFARNKRKNWDSWGKEIKNGLKI